MQVQALLSRARGLARLKASSTLGHIAWTLNVNSLLDGCLIVIALSKFRIKNVIKKFKIKDKITFIT